MYTHLVAVLDQRRIHLTRFRRGQTWLSPQGIRGATTNDTPFPPRGGIWFRRSDTRRQPSCQERTFRTSSTTCPRPPVPPDSPLACYQHSAQQRPPPPRPASATRPRSARSRRPRRYPPYTRTRRTLLDPRLSRLYRFSQDTAPPPVPSLFFPVGSSLDTREAAASVPPCVSPVPSLTASTSTSTLVSTRACSRATS